MVYNRPVRRLRTTGLDDFGRYLSMLEANQNSAEWQAFINSPTTNLTAFFAKGIIFRCCQIMLVGAAVNTASGARRHQPEKNPTALRLRLPIP